MNINIMASVSNTGYGIASKYIITELAKQDHLIKLFPYGNITPNNDTEKLLFQKLIANDFDINATCINIWHQFDLGKRVGRGYYIGFPIFELDKFTKDEISHLTVPDSLAVCSQWAKQIVDKELASVHCTQPVHIVPLGVDSNIFCPQDKKKDDTYRFVNIGKWEKRKGHDLLLAAFSKAFDRSDDVELVMMPHNPFLQRHHIDQWLSLLNSTKLRSKVKVLPKVQTHQQVADVLKSCDCGVFPSRAEGWNMELLEAMACGLPVIATNYSAHTEYCNKDNCFLIDIDESEKAYDGLWFSGQGNWALLDDEQEDQLIEHMRMCYKNKPSNPQGIETAKKLSWANSANALSAI